MMDCAEMVERSVKEETELVLRSVVEKSMPLQVQMVENDSHKPGRLRFYLALENIQYELGGKPFKLPAGHALIAPIKNNLKFADEDEVLSVQIRKMVVEIAYKFSMPTTLLCSEDRYGDFFLHSDTTRILNSDSTEATLLSRVVFHSILKLIEVNNSTLLNSGYAKFLSAMSFISDNLEKSINRAEVASLLEICPDYLNTLFKKYHGANFSQYVIRRKLEYSRLLLHRGLKISQVARKIAYKSDVHYSTLFKKVYGASPKKIQLLMHKNRALTIKERDMLYAREGFKILPELSAEEEARLGPMTPALRSPEIDLTPHKNYVVMFENTTKEPVEFFWLDEQGKRISHGIIYPDDRKESSTQAKRVWVLESKERTAVFLTEMTNCTIVF